MKRQRIRKAIIIVSFLFFPVTIYYFSPALIIMGAAEGKIVGSFMLFGFLFLVSLFLGRAFCGWVCPAAGLQEVCFIVQNKRARGGRWDWIKYIIWVPWIGIILMTIIRAGGLRSIDPFFQTRFGISVIGPEGYIVYYFFIALIVILAFTAGRRAFCHTICWMAPFMVIGRKARNIFKWPALHLEAESGRCVQCKTCTENCVMSLEVHEMVQRGSMNHSECILCGTCIDVCPESVIAYKIFKN